MYESYMFQVNCLWSTWGEWTTCSASCGTGTKEKSRWVKIRAKNGGEPCQGSDTQIDICINRPCRGGYFLINSYY